MLLFLPWVILSCTWENEEVLYPGNGSECDTTDMSYFNDIVPILTTHCFMCHSAENAPAFGSNINLEDYSEVKDLAEIITGAINHDPPYSPMPKNAAKIDSCLILKFEAWVNQGALEN